MANWRDAHLGIFFLARNEIMARGTAVALSQHQWRQYKSMANGACLRLKTAFGHAAGVNWARAKIILQSNDSVSSVKKTIALEAARISWHRVKRLGSALTPV